MKIKSTAQNRIRLAEFGVPSLRPSGLQDISQIRIKERCMYHRT